MVLCCKASSQARAQALSCKHLERRLGTSRRNAKLASAPAQAHLARDADEHDKGEEHVAVQLLHLLDALAAALQRQERELHLDLLHRPPCAIEIDDALDERLGGEAALVLEGEPWREDGVDGLLPRVQRPRRRGRVLQVEASPGQVQAWVAWFAAATGACWLAGSKS